MTTRTLNEFISKIKTEGAARLNRFSVLITNPATSSNADLVQLYCEQAALPSISFASQPTRSYGEQREVVYDRNFETLNLTFIVDRQFKVKEYFDAWADMIIDPTTRLSGYYDEYARNMQIITYDINDYNTYETKIFEAYPKTIGAITLDHNSKDIAKLQISFNYKYHVNNRLISPDDDNDAKNIFKLDATDPRELLKKEGVNLRDIVSSNMGVPDLYYDNFNQYQENINSGLEREGQTIGTGVGADIYE